MKKLILLLFLILLPFFYACQIDSADSGSTGDGTPDATSDASSDASADTTGDASADTTGDASTDTGGVWTGTCEPGEVAYIDLTGAKNALIRVGNSSTSYNNPLDSSANIGEGLFKITEDGYVVEVSFTDASGDTVSTDYPPVAIYRVNEDYSCVLFSQYSELYSESIFLVKNSTGEAFQIIEHGIPYKDQNNYLNSPLFRVSGGYAYYIARQETTRQKIVKLNLTTGVSVNISATDDDVMYFEVDKDGNVAYQGFEHFEGVTDIIYVRKVITPSGIHEIPPYTPEGANLTMWVAPGGMIQYQRSINDGSIHHYVYQIESDSAGDPVFLQLFEYTTPPSGFPAAYSSFYLPTENNIVLANPTGASFYEVYNDENSPEQLNYSDYDIDSVDLATSDSTSIYFAGDDLSGRKILKRVTRGFGSTGSYKPLAITENGTADLIDPDEYSIIKMVPNGSGGIVFSGTRLSDNESVIGEIDSSGNDIIYATGSQAEADALVQLN